jgi:protein-disulfide isomerase
VTIVEFQDFQCPFCKRVQPTIDEIFRRYPGRVRLVFKHRPLPFHERAEPAAVLTLEARAQRGDAGFWRATELLWDKSPALEHADLMDVARRVGLNLARVETALAGDAHRAALALDSELADDVGARGTPHFFVNGRRLVGAQPVEKFVALVDAELAKADTLVKRGVAKRALYEHLMKGAGEKSR